MQERAASGDAASVLAAARRTLVPWSAALADLQRWFDVHAASIWPTDAQGQARARVDLLQQTIDALARGEPVLAARGAALPPAATDPRSIDALLAARRAPRHQDADRRVDERRRALLNLALWQALHALQQHDRPLTALHAPLAVPAAPAPGLSPSLDFARSEGAAAFFERSVRAVLEVLAGRLGAAGRAYAEVAPKQPFAAGLPSLLAWSQAWSVAVAGVHLDHLQRHCDDDPLQAMRELWSGRLDAVRFRTGSGLTALPTHAGALHLDLWTCVLKAQALAFDTARWSADAQGNRWHGVRIDMHEWSGNGNAANAHGLGIEPLYRVVFVDRLQALLAAPVPLDTTTAEHAASASEHTIAIDMDRPRPGHLPNLRLLLRWREPPTGPLRFAPAGPDTGRVPADALQHWLAGQGQAPVAHALAPEQIDWHAASPGRDAGGADGDTWLLGHARLWPMFDAGVQWIDPALVIHIGGAWYELPVDLQDEPAGDRTAWALSVRQALPAGLDPVRLVQAAASPIAMRWVAHEAGLGAFVMAAIDVDAWRATSA
jgi:hypothetical protein